MADAKPFRLLYVEDDDDSVEMLARVFKKQGVPCTMERVTTLQDALRRLHDGGLDVVLLDLGLKDAGGPLDLLAALHRIRSTYPWMPIVILSGNDDADVAVDAIHAGAQDYVVKTDLSKEYWTIKLRLAIARVRAATSSHGLTEQIERLGQLKADLEESS